MAQVPEEQKGQVFCLMPGCDKHLGGCFPLVFSVLPHKRRFFFFFLWDLGWTYLVFKIIIAVSYFCYFNPFKSTNFVVMAPLNKVFHFLGSCLKSKEMAICNSLAILKCKKNLNMCSFSSGQFVWQCYITKTVPVSRHVFVFNYIGIFFGNT